MTRSTIHDFSFEMIGETDSAIKCRDVKKEFWLPKSQVEYVELKGGVVEVQIPEWLAIEKGIL